MWCRYVYTLNTVSQIHSVFCCTEKYLLKIIIIHNYLHHHHVQRKRYQRSEEIRKLSATRVDALNCDDRNILIIITVIILLQCKSKKIPPWNFLAFFPNSCEYLVQILHASYTFLSTLDYTFLFNCLQLWRSYAILSATTIMCSKCPPSTEMHAALSHLIWHNFVTVEDNWIKICFLA